MRITKPIRVLLSVVVLAFVAFWYFQSHAVYTTTNYTCSHCRALERVRTLFGIKSLHVEQTDYSRWFVQSHPQHEHHWCWSGTEMNYYAHGFGRGCGRQHAVWQLQPDFQRQFVESAAPKELDQFYAYMDSPDYSAQQKGAEMVWRKVLGETK